MEAYLFGPNSCSFNTYTERFNRTVAYPIKTCLCVLKPALGPSIPTCSQAKNSNAASLEISLLRRLAKSCRNKYECAVLTVEERAVFIHTVKICSNEYKEQRRSKKSRWREQPRRRSMNGKSCSSGHSIPSSPDMVATTKRTAWSDTFDA